jgi:abequosyltransferase
MTYLISILVPTYQRSGYLVRLLVELERQLLGIQRGVVEVVIADNCSLDDSFDHITSFVGQNCDWRAIRHSSNLGADGNMLSLVKSASGKYIWILGDDDLPRQGLVPLLVDCLSTLDLSLLYLPSFWAPRIDSLDLSPLLDLETIQYLPLDFASIHHVWTTFISSWVINAEHLSAAGVTRLGHESNLGSNLVQLGWILPLILHPSSRLLAARNTCILATSGNSGGYGFLDTFCINYPDMVSRYAASMPKFERALIGPFVASKLPMFILGARLGVVFHEHTRSRSNLAGALKRLWRYPQFLLFCVPAYFVPVSMLKLARKVAHIMRRA